MKVKCVRLLDHHGTEVVSSPWLTLGKTYHVLSIFVDINGKRSFSIVNSESPGEWPSIGSHQAVVPSNWRVWIHESAAIGISPAPWQAPGFAESLFEHDPATYLVFDRERQVILREDP
jgi:hypothetical protein